MLREKHELSLEGLSEKVDIAKSLLWRYEKGKSEPGLSALIALANYFGVTLDWISGNGEIDNVQYSGKKAYCNAVNKCIANNISPENLEIFIGTIKELKSI